MLLVNRCSVVCFSEALNEIPNGKGLDWIGPLIAAVLALCLTLEDNEPTLVDEEDDDEDGEESDSYLHDESLGCNDCRDEPVPTGEVCMLYFKTLISFGGRTMLCSCTWLI